MVTDEAASASSTGPTIKQTGFQLESTNEPVFIPATSPVSVTSGLELVISSRSPKLVIDLDSVSTSPTSLVASTLASMKTSQLLPVSSALLTAGPATPSTIMATKLQETSPKAYLLAWSDRSGEAVRGRDD